MGIFCVGAAFASPPVNETPPVGITVAADTSPLDVGYTVCEPVVVELRYEAATATAVGSVTGLYAVAIGADNRFDVTVPVRSVWAHRWRDNSTGYAYTPVNMIYRPGWMRKVCEG